MGRILKDGQVRKMLVVGSILIILYWAVHNFLAVKSVLAWFFDLMLPFFIGGATAFIFNVPMKHIEKHLFQKEKYQKKSAFHKLRRALAYIVTLILIVSILVLISTVIIPQVSSTITEIIKVIPDSTAKFQLWIMNKLEEYPDLAKEIGNISIDWSSITQPLLTVLSTGTIGIISNSISAVANIFSGVTTFLIAFTFSIYILLQKETLSRQFKKAFRVLGGKKRYDKFMSVLSLAQDTFEHFVSGQCMEACILGTMFFIVMSILRMPYALLVGVTIAITALIPILGAFIGCAIGFLLIALVNPTQAVLFLITFLILQQIEGNLIYPHVVGNSIGLPGIWVLAAVTLGGNLMGVVGMLIFIPIVSVCYSLFREFINTRYAKLEEVTESKDSE